MDWLNYHHLLYFHAVAEAGSIAQAAVRLRLSQPTISAQLTAFQKALGQKLFEKQGRKLRLTEAGRVAFRFADEIVALGREMREGLRGQAAGPGFRLSVGVADVLHKLVVVEVLRPAILLPEKPKLECREGSTQELVDALLSYELDLVLTDTGLQSHGHAKAFQHLLGESPINFFASRELFDRCEGDFPACLAKVPVLLPTRHTSLRRLLDTWFDNCDLRPSVAGEFTDSALLKVFGQQGLGVFPAPAIVGQEIERQYGVRSLGTVPNLKERYYALTTERRIKHPAVLAITERARKALFTDKTSARSVR